MLGEYPLGVTNQPYVYLHRAVLQRILVDRLPAGILRLAEACTAVELYDSPVVRFDNGSNVAADIVIGAEGIGSTVREAVIDGDPGREMGTVTYWSAVEHPLPGLDGETLKVWGAGTRVGVAPLGDGRSFWFTSDEHAADPSEPRSVAEPLYRRYRTHSIPFRNCSRGLLRSRLSSRRWLTSRPSRDGTSTVSGCSALPHTRRCRISARVPGKPSRMPSH